MKKFGSVVKKYVAGYIVVGIVMVLLLLTTVLMSGYISGQYRNAISDLMTINRLENAVDDLNQELNMIYLYFSDQGLEDYEEKRRETTELLAETGRQVEESFTRELADANRMIETYIQDSDLLKAQMQVFLGGDQSVDYDSLGNLYEQQQEVYTYVTSRFQSVYSARLGELSEMEQTLSNFQTRTIVLEAICLTLAVLGCFIYLLRIVRQMSESIKTMMIGVAAIETDAFTAEPIQINSNDEFEEFANAFNEMIRIIQEQMQDAEENAIMREQLSQMEIENLKMLSELQKNHLDFLQSRINPHFLFNTLNMISSLARIEGAEQSAHMTEITASFLRYNLDNISKTVTLRQEAENLAEYIEIQKCRYQDRYEFRIDIAEDCMDFQMPCMVLQPLVENSIQHGIAMKREGGWVQTRGYASESRLFLEVSDNGVGMTQEQIEEFYTDIFSESESSGQIGLQNIYQRLKLFYNDEVQFELDPLDPGLKVTFILPWER